MTNKSKVAVVFGGCSPEHDVSIVTGLQVLQALDGERFDGFPVYVTTDGEWLVGKELADQSFYIPDAAAKSRLLRTSGPYRQPGGHPVLRGLDGKMFSRPRDVPFDIAIPAFHGGVGENGSVQGLFEVMGIPYAGMRPLASAVLMNKIATKRMLAGADVPILPFVELRRTGQGLMLPRPVLEDAADRIGLPCILKPVHLGSSIGVARIASIEDLEAVLPTIFRLDASAMLEPLVLNLAEYNVAVGTLGGAVRCSAIERPKPATQLLDFKEKYLAGGGGSKGKTLSQRNQGMVSLTRDINPDLPAAVRGEIVRCAKTVFELVGGTGFPRIDFLRDELSGKLWMNEVNPFPGSLGWFLWQAADPPILFTDLLTALLDEALDQNGIARLPADPVPVDARLFKRP
jgi:D-alanine-D-alanine ligase